MDNQISNQSSKLFIKNNFVTKIKIGILLCIISLIYLSFFDFLHGRLGFSHLVFPWFIYSFISVFVYPYIKINSQSILKRGLFFGLIAWIINLPQILIDLRYALIGFDIAVIIPSVLLFIKIPLYFIILGLILGFCYKKFFPIEFNLPLERMKIPFVKVIFIIILSALIYFLFMYFAQALILALLFHIDTWDQIIADILNPFSYINSLIYGLIFTVLYITTIRKVDISKIKKWILFGFFISFFTAPLVVLPGVVAWEVFQVHLIIYQFLLLPHLLSIFLIVYLFTRFLDKKSQSKI